MAYKAKVCLLGDFAVGKTSLIRRFVEERFDDSYISSIGVKISRKVLHIAAFDQLETTLMIWDLAGGERFDAMMRNYYAGAAGGLLVYDVTRPDTLDSLQRYMRDFTSVNPHAALIVLGNKADLLTSAQLERPSMLDATLGWYPASAKSGLNVETAFATLSTDCYHRSLRR